jgi:O-antigen ligase
VPPAHEQAGATTGADVVVDQMPQQSGIRSERPRLERLLGRPSLLAGLTVLLVGIPQGSDPTGVDVASVTPADLGAMLLVAVIGLRVVTTDGMRRLHDPVFLCPVLMVVAALVTTVWSTDPMLSVVGVIRYAELFCLVPVAVVLAVRDRVDVIIVLGAIVGLGVVEGAIGVMQSVTGTGAAYQGQTNRAIGTFGVESVLSMATVVSLAQVILIAVALRGPRGWRVEAGVGAMLLVVPLLLSLSRGALLATGCAAAVMVLATGVQRALRLAAVGVAAVVLGLVAVAAVDSAVSQKVGSVAERVGSLEDVVTDPDSSVQDRYDLWATAGSIWRTNPVTGVGIKQFPAFRDSHAPLGMSSGSELATADSYTRGELLSPHSEFLLLLSEQGVLGLGAYLALLLVLLVRIAARLREEQSSGAGGPVLTLAALGLLTWYALHLSYGDLAGSTAVLYAVVLGMQLRSVVTDEVAV